MGGLEQQVRLLGKALLEEGKDVVILGSTRKLSRSGWHDEDGLPIRLFWTYTTPQVSGKKLPASLIWAAQVLVWMFLHRKEISLFHGHQIRIHAFVGAIARKYWAIPNILKSATGGVGADIRAIGTHKYFGAWGRRFIIRNTDCFIATTKSIKDDLQAYLVPETKIRIIPNGLVYPSNSNSAPAKFRARRALFLGRIAEDKNTPALARAAGPIAHPDTLTVHFFGRGEDLPKLRAALSSVANPSVAYCGVTCDPGAVLPEYGYLLLPSNAEGLSNAMLEAMAHGVVPITTRVSGCIDHIVPGETGFFFDGTDVGSLQRGLETIQSISLNQWQQMSQRVAKYVKDRFDIGDVAASYSTLYVNLLGGKLQ